MEEPQRVPQEILLINRMRRARIRQWIIAGISVLLAAICIIFLSPSEISGFAYYTIVALMLMNAILALLQSSQVIFPIERLLQKIHRIESDMEVGRFDDTHFTIREDGIFACLTAGIDNLVNKSLDTTRIMRDRAEFNAALIQATPFTIFTVSKSGRICTILKKLYGIVPLLGLKIGQHPHEVLWGRENVKTFLREVEASFGDDDFHWFDLTVGGHHLRGVVKRINDMIAAVEIGDLPAIDKAVYSENNGNSSDVDYTHNQRTLRHFAASIAHDCKNVFAALANLVALNRNSSDDKVRELVPLADDALSHGQQLMEELSTFSGTTRYTFECVPAGESVRKIFNSPTIKAILPRNVQLSIDINDEELPEVDLDVEQCWKIACNLVKNAVEAMRGQDGHLWVSVKPFVMTEEEAILNHHSETLRLGKGMVFSITDDGPGITTDVINRMFDPYYSSKGEGRGLGLATVMTIVTAHCGAIRVRSSLGSGTTFGIFIPASRNTQRELLHIQEVAPNGEVLLVDDDRVILKTTSLVLKMLKVVAHPAATPEEAMQKLRVMRQRVRAAFVDASLHGVCSVGLLRRIHEEFPKLPVILVSGSPKEMVDSQFVGVKYDHFLAKPYSSEELLQLLNSLPPPPLDFYTKNIV